METVTIPQTMAAMIQAAGQLAQPGGAQTLQGMFGGDAFAQLLQQLLGQTIGAQSQSEDAEKQGSLMAADMFAQLFSGILPDSADMASVLNEMQAGGQIGAVAAENEQPLMQTLFDMVQTQGDVKPEKAGDLFLAQLTKSSSDGEPEMQVISTAQTQGQTSEENTNDLLGGESEFRNSILAAQKLLRGENTGKSQKQEKLPTDVEQLQNVVNSGKFKPAAQVEKTDSRTFDAQDIMAQVKTGIKENLLQGKNEFVVKLKPDGLGEITVKLVEADSKITLSIVTSSPQVAKLINGELAGLRETLRPLNADVHEVVSQADASYAAAQNGQFSQQDMGRQFQQFHQNQAQPMPFSQNEEELDQEALTQSMAPVSELDTYI